MLYRKIFSKNLFYRPNRAKGLSGPLEEVKLPIISEKTVNDALSNDFSLNEDSEPLTFRRKISETTGFFNIVEECKKACVIK